ncbi:hypothetical protein [uncultured Clostridium sp.]|uniref:hypothetical protein n=1 Tax=uncultured Clostridium sp. TaxID=59620 RepID=UPI0025D6163B|nr:hypothetical protein [uncultured Clostridium sp.]
MSNYVMTFSQYRAYERGEKTLREIKKERREMGKAESIATKIIESPRLKRLVVFTIAGLNYASTVLAETTAAVDKINTGGFMILSIVQTIGYWLCLIGCIMEILKSIMNGSSKDVGKIMLKYLLVFGSLYLMPFGFNLIREIFAIV